MDYNAAFNKKLMDFADDLQMLRDRLGIDVPQLSLFKPAGVMAESFDPQQPRRVFHEHVAIKYGQHIKDKNEQFFLENDAYEDEAGVQMDLVSLLKQVWTTLNAGNKAAIWGHLQLLLAIDERCEKSS